MPRKGGEEGWPTEGAKRKKGRVKTGQIIVFGGAMNPNALNAMIARPKSPSGPPNAVMAQGRNRGMTPNAIVAWEKWPRLLI